MLQPAQQSSSLILWIALILLIALLVLRAVAKNRHEFQRFTAFERTRNRQRMMRHWLISSLVTFGVGAALLLVLAWRYLPLMLAAVHAWPAARWFTSVVAETGALIPVGSLILAAITVIGTVIAVYLARNSGDVPTIGDIGSLLPRNRAELYYGAALSLNAGLVEELLFRLAIPVVIFGATGNALVAVGVSVLLFGGLHLYQGVPGIIGATIIGAFLMLLYLATGSIVVPIIAHALIDLRSLVLIPVLVYRVDQVTLR